MQTTAKAKHVRISPRKVRLVVDAVRGLRVDQALDRLRFMTKAAAKPVAKVVASAAANAEHNFDLSRNNLYIKEITVNEAATLKRWTPRAFGRATPIRKRNSHIEVTIAEIVDSGVKAGRKPAVDAPVNLGAVAASTPAQQQAKKTRSTKKGAAKAAAEPVEAEASGTSEAHSGPKQTGRTRSGETSSRGFASKIFRRKSG